MINILYTKIFMTSVHHDSIGLPKKTWLAGFNLSFEIGFVQMQNMVYATILIPLTAQSPHLFLLRLWTALGWFQLWNLLCVGRSQLMHPCQWQAWCGLLAWEDSCCQIIFPHDSAWQGGMHCCMVSIWWTLFNWVVSWGHFWSWVFFFVTLQIVHWICSFFKFRVIECHLVTEVICWSCRSW